MTPLKEFTKVECNAYLANILVKPVTVPHHVQEQSVPSLLKEETIGKIVNVPISTTLKVMIVYHAKLPV